MAYLTKFFNKYLRKGKLAGLPGSYRPVALLSSLSKIFEKMILKRLKQHVYEKQLLPPEQFGFRQGHSCLDQVLRMISPAQLGFNQSKHSILACLDLTQAFDKVLHERIVYKLQKMEFAVFLVRSIYSYLAGRSFRVRVGTHLSSARSIGSGVPQGSKLGPLLFSLYTADIPRPQRDIQIGIYADDTAVCATGYNIHSLANHLQQYLSRFNKYCIKWGLKVNSHTAGC